VDVRRDGDGFRVLCETSGQPLTLSCGRLVLATGARERLLPFPGWTLPNVMGIGGIQALLKAGTSFRGQRIIIAGSRPLILPVAASLLSAGSCVLMVAEQTPARRVALFTASLWRSPARLGQAVLLRAKFFASSYETGTWVKSAIGDSAMRSVMVTDGKRE